ncbi:MAG: heme-binding protein [Burkholderiales bacterium]|nr:heme-binding protein [Burkholderiales bacterium]
MKLRSTAVSAALLLSLSVAQAQGVRTEKNISLELAMQIATAAITSCTAGGYQVAVTVVDRAGAPRVALRADNAGAHALPSSQQKAFTSASAKNNTQALMEGSQTNPGASYLVHIPGFLLLGGGVPIRAGSEVIGAVGVSGAPRGLLDEQCAVAGLDKVRDQLK